MEKLVLLIIFFSNFVYAQSLEQLNLLKIDSDERINNHRYGGISGVSFSDGVLWGISDDKGRYGPPRMYKHSLKGINIKIEGEVLIKEPEGVSVVDMESVYRFKDGRFLIASEGDYNKKPRVLPFVRFWDEKNKWQEEILLADELIPEKIGMQTKGIQSNSAFEAMTVSEDESNLFLLTEVPLFQNQKSEIEFLEFEKKSSKFELKTRRAYLRDKPPEGVIEGLRGVSDALLWKKDHMLVLERWVRFHKTKGRDIGAELFSVNLKDLKKKKLLTLDNELAANWEGLVWGPDLSDGRKLLILVSDNNFESNVPTQFLFMAFKED